MRRLIFFEVCKTLFFVCKIHDAHVWFWSTLLREGRCAELLKELFFLISSIIFLKNNFTTLTKTEDYQLKWRRESNRGELSLPCGFVSNSLHNYSSRISASLPTYISYHKRKWMWFMHRILKMSLCVWDSWKGNILMAFKDHTINQWHWNPNVHNSDLFYSEKSHLK